MNGLPKNVSAFTDRHGKTRYRFRKVGMPDVPLVGEPGDSTFRRTLALARKGDVAGAAKVRRQARRKCPAPLPGGEFVYFVRSGRRVKIGWTTNLRKRIAALRTAAPTGLELLIYVQGGRDLELSYHARFAAERLRGEWFRWAPEIQAEVTNLANRLDRDLANLTKR